MKNDLYLKIIVTCILINVLCISVLFVFVIISFFENKKSSSIKVSEETSANVYNITEEERNMLASLCTLESSVCSEDCQKAVVSVIFNRLNSGKWNKDINGDGKITLYDIIYYPNAFTPASRVEETKGTKESYEAVDYVVKYGPTVPEYVRYFRASKDFSWDNYKNYVTIDNVYFGYFTTWKQGVW